MCLYKVFKLLPCKWICKRNVRDDFWYVFESSSTLPFGGFYPSKTASEQKESHPCKRVREAHGRLWISLETPLARLLLYVWRDGVINTGRVRNLIRPYREERQGRQFELLDLWLRLRVLAHCYGKRVRLEFCKDHTSLKERRTNWVNTQLRAYWLTYQLGKHKLVCRDYLSAEACIEFAFPALLSAQKVARRGREPPSVPSSSNTFASFWTPCLRRISLLARTLAGTLRLLVPFHSNHSPSKDYATVQPSHTTRWFHWAPSLPFRAKFCLRAFKWNGALHNWFYVCWHTMRCWLPKFLFSSVSKSAWWSIEVSREKLCRGLFEGELVLLDLFDFMSLINIDLIGVQICLEKD